MTCRIEPLDSLAGLMEREITARELSKHNSRESLWILIEDDVVDITDYVAQHPGGPEEIMPYAVMKDV